MLWSCGIHWPSGGCVALIMFMTIDSFVTLLAMAMALRCEDILVVDCNYDCYRIRRDSVRCGGADIGFQLGVYKFRM